MVSRHRSEYDSSVWRTFAKTNFSYSSSPQDFAGCRLSNREFVQWFPPFFRPKSSAVAIVSNRIKPEACCLSIPIDLKRLAAIKSWEKVSDLFNAQVRNPCLQCSPRRAEKLYP